MIIKDLINWQAVSRTLANNDNSIRSNKCPKKYQKRVDRLIYIVSLWVKWANKYNQGTKPALPTQNISNRFCLDDCYKGDICSKTNARCARGLCSKWATR